MEYKKLGDIATYINGYAFKPEQRGSEGLPIIRIQDLTGNSYDLGYYNGDYPKKIELNDGDVLISWSASLGVYLWNRGKALLNQHIFKVVFDKVEIDKFYYMYAVEYNLDKMSLKTHGATMKHITKKDFDNVVIPYPDLEYQKEISYRLTSLKGIIEKYQEQLDLLDELIKARFVEMFGGNDKKVAISSLCDVLGGYSFKSEDISSKGFIKILQIGNVYLDDVNWETTNYLPKEFDNMYSRFLLNEGDIVIALTRPIIQSLGNVKACIVKASDTPCLLNQRVGRIVSKKNVDVNLKFIYGCLMTDDFTRYVESCCIGCSQPNISTKDIENYMIPDASYEKQMDFVRLKEQVDKSKFVQNAIDRFSKTDSYPQIAISVDMLDTGIDVPDIVNLVFFKKVRSKAKFWQMIGRGTRLRTDLFGPGDDKKGFLIFDYLGNMDYFRVDQRPEKSGIIESLSQRIYKLRVDILYALEQNASDQDYVDEINKQIKEMSGYIQSLNEDSFNVKMHLKYVHQYKNPDNWINLNEMDTHYIKDELSSLVVIHDEDKRAKFFDRQMYMIEMAYLNHYDASQVINKVIMMADELYKKQTTPDIADNAEYLKCAKDPDYWKTANYFDLEVLREKIRGLVKYLDPGPIVDPVDTHFEDEIIETKMNDAFYNDEGLENYKEKVQHYLKAHEDDEAIYKLRHNQVITPDEMKHLENLLWIDLGSKDDYRLHFGDTPITRLIRKIVGLDRQAAMAEFSRFLDDQSLNSRQIHFVELLVDYIVKNGFIEDKKVLLQDPFKSIGSMSALFKDKMNIAREILKTVDTFSERL